VPSAAVIAAAKRHQAAPTRPTRQRMAQASVRTACRLTTVYTDHRPYNTPRRMSVSSDLPGQFSFIPQGVATGESWIMRTKSGGPSCPRRGGVGERPARLPIRAHPRGRRGVGSGRSRRPWRRRCRPRRRKQRATPIRPRIATLPSAGRAPSGRSRTPSSALPGASPTCRSGSSRRRRPPPCRPRRPR
jgi:hypothetical protein